MKPFVIVVTVASVLVLAAQPRAQSSGTGPAAPQVGRPRTPPPGWSETRGKEHKLRAEGKDLEVLALYEQWVAKYPDFGEGHFRLGDAHASIARSTASSRAPDALTTRRKHFEAAASHMRRGLELAGPDAQYTMMEELIEIHGVFGLQRPAEHERLVAESLTRYPAEPRAHGHRLALLASQGKPIEAAARAARAAIPTGGRGRVALAGALVGHVALYGRLTPALEPTLLPEASRLLEEALKMKPDDAAALRGRRQIHVMQANSSRLPPAEDGGVTGEMAAIVMTQATYATLCGHDYYAPTLAILARSGPGKALDFRAEDLVPAGATTVLEKYRYRIEMTAVPSPKSPASCDGVPAGGSAETFSIVARPLKGFHGRVYRMGADGKLTDIK